MKPIDYAKAAGLAVLVLAANLLITVAVVFSYSQAFARGRSPEFYNELALRIATWSAPAGGALLMFAVGYLFGRRRPERNAIAFALTVFLIYVVIDLASGLAMGPVADMLTPKVLASLTVTGLGGLAGAMLAARRRTA